jgi:hypothetical protein
MVVKVSAGFVHSVNARIGLDLLGLPVLAELDSVFVQADRRRQALNAALSAKPPLPSL